MSLLDWCLFFGYDNLLPRSDSATEGCREEAIRQYIIMCASAQYAMDIWIFGDLSGATDDNDDSPHLIMEGTEYGKIGTDLTSLYTSYYQSH